VDGLNAGLIDISKNLQLGVISTNESVKAAVLAALTTPDAQAIASYSRANCSQQ